jgi:SAM-dependent methyltransferase
VGTEPIADFFDREAEACCRAGPDTGGGVAGVSSVLMEQLEGAGIQGRSLVDLGCGMGGLALEALRRGAARVRGIDLSPASIEVARQRAREGGFGERSTFEVGDASAVPVEPHDAVVLDKALCCYPDPEGLMARAAPSARLLLAFSVPASGGPRGLMARLVVFLENAWRWLRRDPFRAFVHDVRALDARVRASGFELRSAVRWWMWHVAVYARPAR